MWPTSGLGALDPDPNQRGDGLTAVREERAPAVGRELVRMGLWFLLGWFFGLAARDTRGVGIPALLHGVLSVAIYVTLVFQAPRGFLG